ncbi:hypothetical protein DPMN_073580 [Dreissena polymorpha]|uniref:Uncharacterized protein n=1 Tax=Dreissena polymorpha TaxID=45954 RepID=A0A9D4BZC2_DREPO|nr:hypothetical protein DPMN_073580 [Dreissena polymorpha]
MDNWQIGYSDLMEFTQIVMDQVHLWQQSTKYCILLRKECSSNNNNIVNIIQISRGVLLTEASKTGIVNTGELYRNSSTGFMALGTSIMTSRTVIMTSGKGIMTSSGIMI